MTSRETLIPSVSATANKETLTNNTELNEPNFCATANKETLTNDTELNEPNFCATANKDTQTNTELLPPINNAQKTYEEMNNQLENYKHLLRQSKENNRKLKKNVDQLKKSVRYHTKKLKAEKLQKRDNLNKLQTFEENNSFEEICDAKFAPIFSKILKTHAKCSKKKTLMLTVT